MMITATDWTGLGIFVGQIAAGVVAIIGAIYAGRAAHNTKTPSGSASVGELVTNTAAAVSTPPGSPPIGQIAATNAAALEDVHETIRNGHDKPATP